MFLASDQPNAAREPAAETPRRRRIAARLVLVAVPLAAFFAVAILYAAHSTAIYEAMRLWGISLPVDYPFLDLRYIFAGVECWAKGVNVYLSNPCDPLGRPHAYSPLWLRFGFLPGQEWTNVAGLIVDGLFVLSLAVLPPLRRPRELLILLLAILSPPVVFALQRANVDVIIFLIVLVAAWLHIRSLPLRVAGYAAVLLAGLLKFYPLIVLVMAARERPKIGAAVLAIVGAALSAFVAYFHAELGAAAVNIPTGSYLVGDMFGAKNLPNGLVLVFSLQKMSWIRLLIAAVLAALCAKWILVISQWAPLLRAATELPPFDVALLLSGAAIIAGCFFTGQSVGYRGVYLLLLLPGLFALWRQPRDRRVQRFAGAMTFLVLFLMWQGVLTWNDSFLTVLQFWFGASAGTALWVGIWLVRELGWWILAASVGGIFAAFLREFAMLSWMDAVGQLRSGAGRP